MVGAGVELELLVLEMVVVVVKRTVEIVEMVLASAGRWMMTFLKELLDEFLLLVI